MRVEMLFNALDPSHASGGSVSFEPGAGTARHTHPRGQILIVTAGTRRVQRWGDPRVGRLFASWNQFDEWLRQIEGLRFVA